jgi:hypothetical protein
MEKFDAPSRIYDDIPFQPTGAGGQRSIIYCCHGELGLRAIEQQTGEPTENVKLFAL